MMAQLVVLSVMQPWAWLIVHGYPTPAGRRYKDVENRRYRTSCRGELYIHASQTYDVSALEYIECFAPEAAREVTAHKAAIMAQRGQVIGRVELTEVTDEAFESDWAEVDAWHWRLARPTPVDPFPARGMPGLFRIRAPGLIENIII